MHRSCDLCRLSSQMCQSIKIDKNPVRMDSLYLKNIELKILKERS